MKVLNTIGLLALTAAMFVGCKNTESAPPEANATASTATASNLPAKMETASFHIEGMSCAIGCAKTLENKLAKMDGVEKASVDFDKKTATIEFDANKQTAESFVKTVESAADGKTYKVSDVKSSGDHAALYPQDQEKEKSKKKDAKSAAKEGKDSKPACCAGKKHCSADEKKA